TYCPQRLPSTGPNRRYPHPPIHYGARSQPNTPKFKFYLGQQYLAELGSMGELQFNVDWTRTAPLYNDIGNTAELRRPTTNIGNASVTYRPKDAHWEAAFGA